MNSRPNGINGKDSPLRMAAQTSDDCVQVLYFNLAPALISPIGGAEMVQLKMGIRGRRCGPRQILFVSLIFFVASSSVSHATTLLVPEDYTLTAALAAASDGDSISVASGTLDGGMVELTHSITLISRGIKENRLSGLSMDGLNQVGVEGFLFSFPEFGPYGSDEGRVIVQSTDATFRDCSFENLWSSSGPPVSYGGTSNILFEGCTFHFNFWSQLVDGSPSGHNCIAPIGYSLAGHVTIRDCMFQDQPHPVEAYIPFTIEGTKFVDCGPLLIYSDQSLSMTGCLVAGFIYSTGEDWLQPECFGITSCIWAYGNVTIQQCTFVDPVFQNPSSGPCLGHQFTPDDYPAMIRIYDTGEIDHNLFVGLPGSAVNAPVGVSVSCNDVWDVDGPAWRGGIGDVTGTNGNINEAPLFCARWAGDYTLSAHSPAAAENNPCGRMGAYDTACEITPVLVLSFTGQRVVGGVQLRWSLSEAEETFIRRIEQSASPEVYRGQSAGGVYVDRIAPSRVLRYGLGIVQNGEEIFPLETVVVAEGEVPKRTALLGAFPNPFNPHTEIRFVLDHPQAPTLSIYDRAGRLVRRFPGKQYPAGAGSVTWNGQDDSGRPVASGVYFVQMLVEGKQLVQRVALIR